ncbi:MAG: urease accessory protein UreD [Mailhella sp.]|nr:urease accessory protein UreD [Mailhella sp.]
MPEHAILERGQESGVMPFSGICFDCSSFESARHSMAVMEKQSSELAGYLDEPPQMPSGTVGKAGYLRLGFRYDEKLGRTVLADMDRRTPLLAQKALYWEESQPGMACVIIIAATGCVVQGDRLALDVNAGPDSLALITTQCASKVHSMGHNYASQLQTFRLGERSYLEYMPDPLILHRSARYVQDTHVLLPASASFVYGELLVPGRRWHHDEELFGFDLYSAGLRVSRPGKSGDSVLFEERLVMEPDSTDFRNIGVMGGFDVLGSVYAFVPERKLAEIRNAVKADITDSLAWGASILPRSSGLALRVLGRSTEKVRSKMREFHSLVRESVLGGALPPEFLWR